MAGSRDHHTAASAERAASERAVKAETGAADRLLFMWLYRLFPSVLKAVAIVQPETILRWHRAGFRLYWRWKSRSRGGRPKVPMEIQRLIREMSLANRLWGAPRIHGELLKLGIEVAQSTVAKYMAKSGRGRSQTWKTFLHNHTAGIGAMDFLVVPTVGFKLLFVLVILRHERRRLISLSVTEHPTAEWIARQITDAFPWKRRRITWSGIGTGAMVRPSRSVLLPWAYAITRRPTIALAERACGEVDRVDPPGMPRSHRRFSARLICGESLRPTRAITTDSERICPWSKDSPGHRPVQRLGQLAPQPILGGLHPNTAGRSIQQGQLMVVKPLWET